MLEFINENWIFLSLMSIIYWTTFFCFLYFKTSGCCSIIGAFIISTISAVPIAMILFALKILSALNYEN